MTVVESAFSPTGAPRTGPRPDAPSISVVVPVYNSEQTLPPLAERLLPVLREEAREFELVLVNDGSRDGSWRRIVDLCDRHPWVSGIDLMRNYGQHNALLCGVRAARYEVVVTMDDDLQHPPEEIPRLLSVLAEGCDVVYGTPREEQHGFWRDVASKVTKLVLQEAMGASVARQVSAFRAFRTEVRSAFGDYRSPFLSLDVLLTWGTSRFAAVAVRHEPRRVGRSNYTFRKLLDHALNMLTGFSTIPLQLATVIGLFLTVFGVGVLLYVAGHYFLVGTTVQGFTFLASIIALFSGAQLFALGMIGEYLARMHFRMMEQPTYTVRERVASPAASE